MWGTYERLNGLGEKSIDPKVTLTTTFKYSLSKQDDGWSYRCDFKMVDTDRATHQQKNYLNSILIEFFC